MENQTLTEGKVIPFHQFLTEELEKMELKVHDIMNKEEIHLLADDTVEVAHRVMEWEGLEHACIFNHSGELVGVVSLVDIEKHHNPSAKLKNVMRTDFHKIYGQLRASTGREKVSHESTHCMPVFENQKIIGILDGDSLIQKKGLTRTSSPLCSAII